MGGGSFSFTNYASNATKNNYHTKSAREIFTQRNISNVMNPHGIIVRESRDSAEHPNSLAIILGLDVTGSMGHVPHHLVKTGLPTMVDKILKMGVADPQLLFLGIGDHECDSAPLQVGQFESSDELLDKWLTTVFLEGGGGGNGGESYLLAWYFAAYHTSIDCFEKRNQKGFLFTIGDEPVLPNLPKVALRRIMGEGNQYEDYTASRLFEEACKKYNTYHIHVMETSTGKDDRCLSGWRETLGNHLLVVESHTQIPDLIANKIHSVYSARTETPSVSQSTVSVDSSSEDMLL